MDRADAHLPARADSPDDQSHLHGRKEAAAPSKGPETAAWKRQLLELLQASLTRAKYEKNIELDLLLRVALINS